MHYNVIIDDLLCMNSVYSKRVCSKYFPETIGLIA